MLIQQLKLLLDSLGVLGWTSQELRRVVFFGGKRLRLHQTHLLKPVNGSHYGLFEARVEEGNAAL